jgi:hypothetical protein
MSAQTTPGHTFPAPCKRCGGALYQPADLCPYCGATHPLDEPPSARFVPAGDPAHHPLSPDPHPEPMTPNLASPDTPIPPLIRAPLGSGIGSRWLLTRGLIGLVVVLLGYGGYALLGDHHSATPSDDEQDAKTTAGPIAPYTAGISPGTPVNTKSADAPSTSAGPPQAAPQPVAAPPVAHYRDLAESLHAARARREANDLSGAQAAVNAAFSMESSNADAQMIQHELTTLEQRRDAALQTAQVCIKDHLWNCVAHSASDALAIDSGSAEAKTLLARAIVETGWAPLGRHTAQAPRTAAALHATQAAPPVPVTPDKPAAPPAPDSVDAQARAIAESGWRNSATTGTKPASAAAAAH